MEIRLTSVDFHHILPARPVRTLVQIQWPLAGQALSPHNDKSVKILCCNVCLVGWVRINPKYGSMRGNAASQPASPLLEKIFGSELQSGSIIQMFDSGPTKVCSDVRLCPGDVFNFLHQATLPPALPPSFRGKCFSIVYSVAAEVQLEGIGNIKAPPRTLHLPLSVGFTTDDTSHVFPVPLYGRPDSNWHDFAEVVYPLPPSQLQEVLASIVPLPRLPPSREGGLGSSPLSRGFRGMRVCSGDKDVLNVGLPEGPHVLGNNLLVLLDFSQAQVECEKITLSLEACEALSSDFALTPTYCSETVQVVTRTVSTLSLLSTNCMLTLPLTAAPTLNSILGSVTWALKLQIFLRNGEGKTEDSLGLTWSVPLSVCAPTSDLDLSPLPPSRATPLLS